MRRFLVQHADQGWKGLLMRGRQVLTNQCWSSRFRQVLGGPRRRSWPLRGLPVERRMKNYVAHYFFDATWGSLPKQLRISSPFVSPLTATNCFTPSRPTHQSRNGIFKIDVSGFVVGRENGFEYLDLRKPCVALRHFQRKVIVCDKRAENRVLLLFKERGQ